MKILNSLILSFCLLFAFGIVLAQETSNGTQAVSLDENVTAEDLGVSETIMLPDSPFYFFKNLGRAIQSAITLDPIKKAELREKFANEKLIELKKMTEKTQNSEVLQKATKNFQQEVENVKNAVEKIKEKAGENNEVGKFLDKFIQQQTLQQKILHKLETQVSTTTMERIREVREQHLEKFGEVMTRLENKENIQQRLEKNLEEVKGSQFKDFKNLEILKELEAKVPEAAKEAIQKAQENALKRLQGNLEKMSPEDQIRFKEYLKNISGDKEKQLEIMENLKARLQDATQTPTIIKLRERLEEGKTEIFEKIEQRLEELNCPRWMTPVANFCPTGRVVIQKDEKGCSLPPKCVVPAETNVVPNNTQVCIALWNPVCGKDGKTYSNSCSAKSTGVEIDYEGMCKEKIICDSCPQEMPMQPDLEAQLRKECIAKGGKWGAKQDKCGCPGPPKCTIL